jgi:hypothetical protein
MKILALWGTGQWLLNTTNKLSLDVYIVQHTIFVHWIITYQALFPHERGVTMVINLLIIRRRVDSLLKEEGDLEALFFVLSQCL